MPSAAALLDRAADHLTRAADLAEPTDPAFAGQIRLAAAALPTAVGQPGLGGDLEAAADPDDRDSGPTRHTDTTETPDVTGLLELALDSLDQIPPLDGPADLQLCAWHLHELRRIAATGLAS